MGYEYQTWLELLQKNCANQDIEEIISALRKQSVSVDEIEIRRRVYSYLCEQKALCIAIDDALNLGHQASAMTLAQSLSELGYKGSFTFIVPGSLMAKIHQVMPAWLHDRAILVPAPDFDPCGEYKSPAVDVRGLVLVAASDRLDHRAGPAFLSYTGADDVIVLKPFAWPFSERMVLRRKGKPVDLSSLPALSVYRYSAEQVDLGKLDKYLKPEEAAGLTAVLKAAQSGDAVVIPVYGLHRLEDPERAAAYSILVGAVRTAYAGRRVILVEIGTTRVRYAPTPSWLRTLVLSDPTVPDAVFSLLPENVLSITAQTLPQDVFREVYRTGAAPRVLEGANTANYVQLLGLPYLTPRTADTPYPGIDKELDFPQDQTLDVAQCLEQLSEVTKALNVPTNWSSALRESATYVKKLYPCRTALSVVTSDLKHAAQSNKQPTLSAETIDRLGKVTDLDLVSIVGAQAAGNAKKIAVAYAKRVLRGEEFAEVPDALVMSDIQATSLKQAIESLIDQYGPEIASEIADASNDPGDAEMGTVQKALLSMSASDGPLRLYFQRLGIQAANYRYDQVLNALNQYIIHAND